MLRDMAGCGKHRNDSHACANLHKLLHRSGHMLPVKFSFASTPVRLAVRGSSKKALVRFPLLKLSDWCHTIFRNGGQFLLGGQTLDHATEFSHTLRLFWKRFKCVEPQLPFYEDPDNDWGYCIPVALHGDEGRGSGKKPVMVLSAQPLIVSKDMSTSNLKGLLCLLLLSSFLGEDPLFGIPEFLHGGPVHFLRHTLCTRLLLTVIPSWMYMKDVTVQTLLSAIVEDIQIVQKEGIKASKFFFGHSFLGGSSRN